MLSNENLPKTCFKFYCENCDYGTSKKSSYNDHLTTRKHKKATFSNISNENLLLSCSNLNTYNCNICNKEYKDNSGLWRHRKKCKENFESKNELNSYQEKIEHLTNVVLDVFKKNHSLQEMLIDQSNKMYELAKEGKYITTNNNNNNTTNNTFNLQIFLNEHCKNALNIKDFVESIQVQLSDLENTGRLGYVEGISKIIIHNLEQLNTRERPIHCSDSKRETLYIKDDDQWLKDTEDKAVLTKAIKQVANKNMKQISEWQKENPDYNDSSSKKNDQYLKIICNSMSGSTPEEQKNNINKIVKNIAKEVVIEK